MNIYLDNAATTKPFPEVVEIINETMLESFGNPSSVHFFGRAAAAVTENARDTMAQALNAKPDEIYFSSGGTESDNIAVAGAAKANVKKGKHIIVSAIEHPAVLNTAAALEKEGFSISYAKPDANGIVPTDTIKALVRSDTSLISLMYVNNELGTIQNVSEVGAFCKQNGILFHTDAVQAFGKIDIDVKRLNIDMLSASAHKINGAKGVGLLFIKSGTNVQPVMYGGGQERGIKSGTVNAPGIAGFEAALKLTLLNREKEETRIKSFKARLLKTLTELGCEINADTAQSIPHILNVYIPNAKTDELLYSLDINGLSASAGSACSAGSIEPTNVIKQIGKDKNGASLRLSFGALTTLEEIAAAEEIFYKVIPRFTGK